MRKPVFAICEQQRRRSDCAFAQSDQHLCYLLPRYIISLVSMSEIPVLCAGRFVSYLVANPEDRFSCDEAHNMLIKSCREPMSGN